MRVGDLCEFCDWDFIQPNPGLVRIVGFCGEYVYVESLTEIPVDDGGFLPRRLRAVEPVIAAVVNAQASRLA